MLHYEPAIYEAAALLLNKIENIDSSIANLNYPSETTAINDLSESFATQPELKSALSLLGLNDWIARMKAENDFFNQRYLDRVDEKSKQLDDKMKELRKTARNKYRTLKEHIAAHAILDDTGNYKSVIDQINELIDTYNNILNRRSNSKE